MQVHASCPELLSKCSVQQLLGCTPRTAAVVDPLTDVKLVMHFGMKRAIISVSYIILYDQIHGQVAEITSGQIYVILILLPIETTI